MGYESKLIVVNKFNNSSDVFGDVIAEINLSVMSADFFSDDVFSKSIGEQFLVLRGEAVSKDSYGKPLAYGSVEDVLRNLYKCESFEHYRRTRLAINVLETFNRSTDWSSDGIDVFHYGY